MPRADRAIHPWASIARTLAACAGLAIAHPATRAHAEPVQHTTRAEPAPGLALLVRRLDAAPTDQASLRLVVRGGAGEDSVERPGAAHVISHALWDSALDRLEARARSGDGAAGALLDAMGPRRHAHRAASVDMFATVFELDLTGADAGVVREATRFLTEIASLAFLDDDALLRAKERVVQEVRGWSSPYMRINRAATGAVFAPLGIPASPFAASDDEIARLTPEDIRAQAEHAFAHGRVTLVGAGAVDAQSMSDALAGVTLRPAPLHCPMVVDPPIPPSRGVVTTDPEVNGGLVELLRVERTEGGEEAFHERLLRAAAANALQRRIEIAASTRTGDDALSELIVFSKPFAPGATLNVLHAMTAPGQWRGGIEVLTTELRRVETHGFSPGETRLALARALAPLRAEMEQEATGGAAGVASRLARRLATGEPTWSAQEELLAAEAALADATPDDLRRVAIAAFLGEGDIGSRGLNVLAAVNSTGADLDEGAVLAHAKRFLLAKVEAPAHAMVEPADAGALFEPGDHDGGVREVRIDPASAVLTMTLSNNIVAHHRATGAPGGHIVLEAFVRGGEINEVAGVPRGVTDAALSAWRDPATASLGAREIADTLAGASVRVRAWAEPDGVRLTIRAAPDDTETAVRLAAALLSSPRVEDAAIERWRQSALERAAIAETQPFERLRTDLWSLASETGDPRLSFPTSTSVGAIDANVAQAWLDRLLAEGAVEIALTGGVTRDRAADLCGRLLGALPQRPPIVSSAGAEAPSRTVARIEATTRVDSLADHGAALVGVMFDLPPGDADDWVAGELAARALSARVRATLAGDLAISNDARALWMPIDGWRGFSLLYTPIVTGASRLDDAASAVWAEYTRLAREGLAQSDFEEARASLRRSIAAELERPEAWAGALAGALLRGEGVRALLNRQDAAARATPDDVRAFVAAGMERGAVRTIVTPRRADEGRASPAR